MIDNSMLPGVYRGKKIWVTTDIVDARTIISRLGYKHPSTISVWRRRYNFPAPLIRLGSSYGWYWPDVQRWWTQHHAQVEAERRAEPRLAASD